MSDDDSEGGPLVDFRTIPLHSGDLTFLLLHENRAWVSTSFLNIRPDSLHRSANTSVLLVSTAESISFGSLSPLAGDYRLVLTSHTCLPREEINDDMPLLHSALRNEEEGPTCHCATPVTQTILRNAIAWLSGETPAADDNSLLDLASVYIHALHSLNLRNCSTKRLAAFIRDRQWPLHCRVSLSWIAFVRVVK